MQDKKVIALIVLTLLAVISLVYGVKASSKGRVISAASSERQIAAATPQGANNVVSTKRRAQRSKFKMWKRNPFASGLTTATMSELTLNGIIWNKTKPKAMIGDVIVTKGDTVGTNKVVDILPNKVILNDGTKDFDLKIEK